MFSKKQINVGGLKIGGNAPISVQTMTNTKTEDIEKTLEQIEAAIDAGADLVRISCPTVASTRALKAIIQQAKVPIIADIHFNYKRAIEAIESGADCIRINPDNIKDLHICEIAECVKTNGKAIRIGINSGSTTQKMETNALIEKALFHVRKLESLNFANFKISVKSSNVKTMVESYRRLRQATEHPLHLGVTEAGPIFPGTIKSAVGIGALLLDGVGDTIRVSLSTSDIVEEVKVGRQILKSLHLLPNSVNIISCPTCARSLINVVRLANDLDKITEKTPKDISISILGCVVNGPGEALTSNIGIFGYQDGIAKIYVDGQEVAICQEDEVVTKVSNTLSAYVAQKSTKADNKATTCVEQNDNAGETEVYTT